MRRIQLIHWNADEAGQRAQALRSAGYEVSFEPFQGPETLRKYRTAPPAAFVIDLSRLPSHGRDVALALREYKSTRQVPIVFVEGAAEKVDRIRQLLPDADFTTWNRIRSTLKKAVARLVSDPVVPSSRMAGYSGTPLPKKLGIKSNSVVALIGAPDDFLTILGALPEGVAIRSRPSQDCNLAIWFTHSREELSARIKTLAAYIVRGSLWIAWPKKSSTVAANLTPRDVREAGLSHGLVDYKICAIDATWSGLLFTRRKAT